MAQLPTKLGKMDESGDKEKMIVGRGSEDTCLCVGVVVRTALLSNISTESAGSQKEGHARHCKRMFLRKGTNLEKKEPTKCTCVDELLGGGQGDGPFLVNKLENVSAWCEVVIDVATRGWVAAGLKQHNLFGHVVSW